MRMDHPPTHHLEPSSLEFNVNFHRRLGERKIARPKTQFHVISKKFFIKMRKRALEVRERNIFVYIHPIKLEKLRFVSRVRRFVAKNFPRKYFSNRQGIFIFLKFSRGEVGGMRPEHFSVALNL